ncbi:MAG: hypothetical protein ACKPKO_14925, partial [Candidatus Fonsibacter sp.]
MYELAATWLLIALAWSAGTADFHRKKVQRKIVRGPAGAAINVSTHHRQEDPEQKNTWSRSVPER